MEKNMKTTIMRLYGVWLIRGGMEILNRGGSNPLPRVTTISTGDGVLNVREAMKNSS